MQVVDVGLVSGMFSADEIVDHARLQGSGTKQCNECDEIVELVGAHALYQVTHAARFELEHGCGMRALQQTKRLWIVLRDSLDGKVEFRTCCIDDLDCPVNDRQCFQSEEIELHEANRFDIILVQLGNDVGAALFAVQRRKVCQRTWRNDDAAGVLSGISNQSLK